MLKIEVKLYVAIITFRKKNPFHIDIRTLNDIICNFIK